MAIKVFNNRQTFLLEAEDGSKMTLRPMGFSEVPEKFIGCPIFKMGVNAGVIQVFESVKQGEKLERAANEPAKPKTEKAKGKAAETKPAESKDDAE